MDAPADIAELSYPLALFLSYVGGFATALTPCVYPLIPITLGVVGAGHSTSWISSLFRSCAFVFGLVVVYSLLGLIAGTTGLLFGSLAQHPYVTYLISALFFAMGLSLLGLFEIRLPGAIANALAKRSAAGTAGIVILGGAAGLMAAPCAGPVAAAILAYVAKSSSPEGGFFLLFAYSAGLGTPFLILGTFSGLLSRIPRGGVWTEWVKRFCGLALIAAAFWFLRFSVHHTLLLTLVSLGLILTALLLPRLFPAADGGRSPWHGRMRLAITALAFVFLYSAYRQNAGVVPRTESTLPWVFDETQALTLAGDGRKPLIIDFYADWCAMCREFDRKTFADPAVADAIRDDFVFLKIDSSVPDERTRALSEKYDVHSLPTILFLRHTGEVLRPFTLNRFIPPQRFLDHVRKVKSKLQGWVIDFPGFPSSRPAPTPR